MSDRRTDTMERLGARMVTCVRCNERFVYERIPQHWLTHMYRGEVAGVELACSLECANALCTEHSEAKKEDADQADHTWCYTPVSE